MKNSQLLIKLKNFIDCNYIGIESSSIERPSSSICLSPGAASSNSKSTFPDFFKKITSHKEKSASPDYFSSEESLAPQRDDVDSCKKNSSDISSFISQSFQQDAVAKRLNLYMYEKDITTATIYERCFVDRRTISKITTSEGYHPSKKTMLALCIGLRLNFSEGEEFLKMAGYGFSNSSIKDLIIKFMLLEENYDLDVINEMLYSYGEEVIGA